MPRSLFLVNIILIVIAGLLGVRLYKTWTRPLELPVVAEQKQNQTAKKGVEARRENVLNEAAYQGIVTKDLFRPSRMPVLNDSQGGKPPVPQEKPQLFGTTIMGSVKFAILEDPTTKISRLYYVNDAIGGFTIADITEEKIILKWGDEMIDLRLRDNKNFIAPKIMQPAQPAQQPHTEQPQQVQPGTQAPAPRRVIPPRRRPPIVHADPSKEDGSQQ